MGAAAPPARRARPAAAAEAQAGAKAGLEGAAARAGRTLGVKFTNTLVVENHKSFFPASEKLMYLSVAPLHVLAVQLAHRFTEATDGRYPISFSAGIDRHNFHEVVACGIVPVTTCTDLLRPGGYGRLTKYLENLEAEMDEAGATTVAELTSERGGTRRALAAYAERVLADPRYAVAKNSSVPRRIGRQLQLFDCINCDKCIPVCPNDANFSVETPHLGPIPLVDLVAGEGGRVAEEPAGSFQLAGEHQLATYADFCNECGNCDVFCPEWGGPYKVKPRFFGAEASYRAAAALDGFVLELGRMVGRIDGQEHQLELGSDTARFSDGKISATIDGDGRVVASACAPGTPAGHRLPLWRYHAMRALYEGVLAGVNPVSARYLRV